LLWSASIPAKFIILAALEVVVVTKREPGLRAYTNMAIQAGEVVKEELLCKFEYK
jgi:hypothetical protein